MHIKTECPECGEGFNVGISDMVIKKSDLRTLVVELRKDQRKLPCGFALREVADKIDALIGGQDD